MFHTCLGILAQKPSTNYLDPEPKPLHPKHLSYLRLSTFNAKKLNCKRVLNSIIILFGHLILENRLSEFENKYSIFSWGFYFCGLKFGLFKSGQTAFLTISWYVDYDITIECK